MKTKCKQTTAFLTAMTLSMVMFGCGKSENDDKKQIKEFTSFFGTTGRNMTENNDIQQLIAEKTGVIVHESWLADQDDKDTIFSEMIMSNKYPDYIYADAANCQRLINEHAFIPIDNYWDDYPILRSFCTESEWNRVRSDDGHIYYIPLFSSNYEKETSTVYSEEAFWVQVKVLQWAGYPDIKTLDEYFDLLESYVEANPTDANGEPYIPYEIMANDSFFFALDNPPMFLDGYPNDGCCIVDTETLEAIDYNLTPTAKKWFKKLNEEYKKGIIDPDCFVHSSEQYYNTIKSGRVLGMVDQQWNFNSSTYDLPDDCKYIPLNVTISRSIPGKYHSRTAFNDSTGLGITTSCDDPETAVKFLDDLLSPEISVLRFWGIEGEDYMVDENGVFYQTEEQKTRYNGSDYKLSHICEYTYLPYFMGMAPDKINAYCPTFQSDEFYSRQPEIVKECFDAYGVKTYVGMMNEAEENPPWYPMWSFSNAVTADTDYGKVMHQIDELKHRYLPLIVMSDDFESAWERYVEEYQKIDTQVYFDELTAEVRRRAEK